MLMILRALLPRDAFNAGVTPDVNGWTYLWQFTVLHFLRLCVVGLGCPHPKGPALEQSFRALQGEMNVAPESCQLQTMNCVLVCWPSSPTVVCPDTPL
jgi:hypothetical protein